MSLPDESRDVIGKSQEIWNWLVHPPPCKPASNRVKILVNIMILTYFRVFFEFRSPDELWHFFRYLAFF